MFCTKCGAMVSDEVKFCPMCGSSIEIDSSNAKTVYIDPNAPAQTYEEPSFETDVYDSEGAESPLDKAAQAAGIKCSFSIESLLTVILLLFAGVALQCNTFRLGLYGFSTASSLYRIIDMPFLRVIAILLYIASIAVAMLPLILKTKPQLPSVIVPMVCSALTILLIGIVWIVGCIEGGRFITEFGLTFAGWVAVLMSGANIAINLLNLISKK